MPRFWSTVVSQHESNTGRIRATREQLCSADSAGNLRNMDQVEHALAVTLWLRLGL
jgi:hypothetical protein